MSSPSPLSSSSSGEPFVTEIATEECLGLLSAHEVGRLCVVDGGFPLAFPVNYRVVPGGDGGAALVVRTRHGSVLDQSETRAGFEIDGIDPSTSSGWSVVVRGILHHADASLTPPWLRSWDPRPWVGDRDSWLYLTPVEVTGRRLASAVVEWAFAVHGYL